MCGFFAVFGNNVNTLNKKDKFEQSSLLLRHRKKIDIS